MTTLRDMIDGRTLRSQAELSTNKDYSTNKSKDDEEQPQEPSTAAEQVARHIHDPFGETKDAIDELNEAQIRYDMAKQKMARGLTPVHQIVKGIDQQHNLGVMQQSPLMQNPDESMGYTDPNDPNAMMDPATGNAAPGNPSQGGANMPPPPASSKLMPTPQPGPGTLPGPAQSGFTKAAPKLGMPQPGQSEVSKVAGNPQQNTFNPTAPKPKGAGALPGANGPGAAKVQNKIGQAQGKKPAAKKPAAGGESGRKIRVEVHADSATVVSRTPIAAALGVATLRSCDAHVKAYGTSEGVRKEWETRRGGGGSDPASQGERAAKRDNVVRRLKEQGWSDTKIADEIGMDMHEYHHTYGNQFKDEIMRGYERMKKEKGAPSMGGHLPEE